VSVFDPSAEHRRIAIRIPWVDDWKPPTTE